MCFDELYQITHKHATICAQCAKMLIFGIILKYLKALLTIASWDAKMLIKGVNFIKKTLTVRLEEELHRKFKIYAIKCGKDMQDILAECIEKLLNEDAEQK